MVNLGRISLLLGLTLALLIPGAASAVGDAFYMDSDGRTIAGHRCGTHTPTAVELDRNAVAVQRFRDSGGSSLLRAVTTIPVAVHVVRMDDGSCDVTDTQIADQMAVLNAAYASHDFQFTLASVERINNTRWSTHRYGTSNERKMKEALAVDPATTFNLYFCNIGGGLLGYATFPYMYPEDSYMHGVVALYGTVPGGWAAPYDEGDTVTHELGHFLGLYHTFQGGCTEPNDYCDDTPQEATPAYGCPEGRDSCPSDPGLDPIHNFMDYSDDYCMYEFTSDQTVRMVEQMNLYRPTMMGGGTGTAPTASFSGTPTGGEYPLVVQFTDQSAGSPTSWSWTFGDGGTSTAQNPSHTYTAVGDYSVTLIATNEYGSDTLTRSAYIHVTEPGSGGDAIHVADITVTRVQSGRKYYGRAVVSIVDEGGAAVSGATVTGLFTGDVTETRSGVTGADGTVTLSTARKYTGTNDFCFEVTAVALTGFDYDSAANLVTKSCEDGDVFRAIDRAEGGIQGIHPNPFNPSTVVSFSMVNEGRATVRIYDVQGRVVETLFDGVAAPGTRSVTWDTKGHVSGIYFCQFQTAGKVETRKMTLMR